MVPRLLIGRHIKKTQRSGLCASSQWKQVILGVGRTFEEELGENSVVRVNGGERIFSTELNLLKMNMDMKELLSMLPGFSGRKCSFTVGKDTSAAKKAIDKFVEEFNDAQDYIDSLVAVSNDGDRVSAGKFSSNLEISQLRSTKENCVWKSDCSLRKWHYFGWIEFGD